MKVTINIDPNKFYANEIALKTHVYTEQWESTEIFCPNCGKKHVWGESTEGDYYHGPQYICTECNVTFFMPCGIHPIPSQETSDFDTKRLNALKGYK